MKSFSQQEDKLRKMEDKQNTAVFNDTRDSLDNIMNIFFNTGCNSQVCVC